MTILNYVALVGLGFLGGVTAIGIFMVVIPVLLRARR